MKLTRFRFRPKFWITFFAFLGVVILCNLGLWQLRRFDEQSRRHSQIQDTRSLPPLLVLDETAELWRTVSLKGVWVGERYLVEGRKRWSQPGYDVLQVLQQHDSDSLVLVNRGWVPLAGYEQHLEEDSTLGAEAIVVGVVQPLPGQVDAEPFPPTKLEPERWGYDNYRAISGFAGTIPLMVFTWSPVRAKEWHASVVPHLQPKLKKITHLQYAGTWLVIALLLCIHWVGVSVKTLPETIRAPRINGE
jgi:cytochrome oxidase assembly protein ShyY1